MGWGKKWKGFRDKLNAVYKYIKKLNDKDIVIFLDGFDVWIKGDLKKVNKIFKKNKYKLLFSKEPTRGKIFNKHIITRIFPPKCDKESTIINTGLYMGYVKYIKIILKDAVKQNEKDDQRILNLLCDKYNFLSIDYKNKIFENVSNKSQIKLSKAVFIQFPGKPSITRYSRAIKEYSPYFKYELTSLIIFIIFIYLFIKYYNLIKHTLFYSKIKNES